MCLLFMEKNKPQIEALWTNLNLATWQGVKRGRCTSIFTEARYQRPFLLHSDTSDFVGIIYISSAEWVYQSYDLSNFIWGRQKKLCARFIVIYSWFGMLYVGLKYDLQVPVAPSVLASSQSFSTVVVTLPIFSLFYMTFCLTALLCTS